MSREFSPRLQVLSRSDKSPLTISLPSPSSSHAISTPSSTTSLGSDAGFSSRRSNAIPHPVSVPLGHRGLPSPNDGFIDGLPRGLPTAQHPSPSMLMRDNVLSRKTPVGNVHRTIMPSLNLANNEKLSRRQRQNGVQLSNNPVQQRRDLHTPSPTPDGILHPESLPPADHSPSPLAAFDAATMHEYPSPLYQDTSDHSALEPMPAEEAGSALPDVMDINPRAQREALGVVTRLRNLGL